MATSTPPGERALPAPPPPPPSPPPLVRRTGDRLIAGVAAAIGRRWGIDPVIVRVLFVVGVFTAFLGPIVYAALWLAMPQVDEELPTTSGGPRPPTFWLGAVLLAIGGMIVLSRLPAPGILVPIALIAVGVALWQRPSQAAAAPGGDGGQGRVAPGDGPDRAHVAAATSPSGPPSATASTPVPAGGPASIPSAGTSERATRDPDVRWWVPPEPRPAPSWLGPIAVAVALVATGIVAALGAADVLMVEATDLVATPLLVLAAALVVGTVVGRAKWIALPGAVLAVALVGIEIGDSIGLVVDPSVGRRWVAVDETGDAPVRLGAGELHVDLTDAPRGTDTPLELDLGAGRLELVVPWDADVVLTGNVGAGNVELVDVELTEQDGTFAPTGTVATNLAVGLDLVADRTIDSPVSDEVVVVDLAVGVGEVEIRRAWPPEPEGDG